MVNKARLITEEHGVNAQGEELVVVSLLDFLLSLLFLLGIVHVKQVAQALIVIEGAAHIAMLFSYDFTLVLAKLGAFFDIFQGKETPHGMRTLLYSLNLQLVLFLFGFGNQIVVAAVFITAAHGVALVKVKNFVRMTRGPRLKSSILTVFWISADIIGRIYEILVPFVANAYFCVLAAVFTCAVSSSLYLLLVFLDVFIGSEVFSNVLKD